MNIQQLIDQYLALEQEEHHEPSGKFTPSAFGQCYRRQIWKRKGEPPTNPPDHLTLRKFKMGHIIHQTIYDMLPKNGLHEEYSTEVEINMQDIKGFADIVTENMVIDLKSVHSRKFWHLGRKKDETEDDAVRRFQKEQKDNILQVMAYCFFLDKPFGKLVYISKDDWCINEYEFKLSEWTTQVSDELYILRGFWEKKELPHATPRLYPQKDGSFKECTYCQFKDKCQEQGEKSCLLNMK